MYATFSELVVFMNWTGKSMNNILTYCGLVDARKSASEKDLPVIMGPSTKGKQWHACCYITIVDMIRATYKSYSVFPVFPTI